MCWKLVLSGALCKHDAYGHTGRGLILFPIEVGSSEDLSMACCYLRLSTLVREGQRPYLIRRARRAATPSADAATTVEAVVQRLVGAGAVVK